MADIERTQQMIPSIRREISLVNMSASWFLVSIYLIWILGSKLIRSNIQSRATLWVLETCLIVGLLPFDNHLDHCFVVLKHIQQSFLMRRLDVWGNTVNAIQHVGHPLRSLILVSDNGTPRSFRSLNYAFQGQKQSNPTIRERESRPISIQRPKNWFRILLNCV